MRRLFGLVLLVLSTTACSAYRLVEPPRASAGGLSVDPQIRWSAVDAARTTFWTVDGLSLQRVSFRRSLADGEALPGPRGRRPLVFRASMTPGESMELVVDVLASDPGFRQLEARNLRPRRFGPADGFAFDFAYVDRNDLEGQGLAAGGVVGGRLHVIVYSGLAAHYFPKYRDAVERMIDSVRIE